MNKLILRELNKNDENLYLNSIKRWKIGRFDGYKQEIMFVDFIDNLQKNKLGTDLPSGYVASTMLYGFVNNEIVGSINIRHQLNENLKRYGGHIGYAVDPMYRNKGYATEMFKQAIPICVELKLNELIITCDDVNIPSIKIIEKFGCVLQEKYFDSINNRITRIYNVKLKEYINE